MTTVDLVRVGKSAENGRVRPARLTIVAGLLAGVAGCWTQRIGARGTGADGGGTGSDGQGGPWTTERFQIIPTQNQLDLLLVIDDDGTADVQQKLAAQLPALLQMLEQLPDGLPDLHVGVISTDLGAGPQPPSGCTATGKGGQMQSAPGGNCADTTLAAGATFLVDRPTRNFTGPLDSVLPCVAVLGSNGCSFRQPLAAIARALGADGAEPPPQNQGFLRRSAALGILILSSGDDCSPGPDSALFSADPGLSGLGDALGPRTPYRCNRGGHLCLDPTAGMMPGPPPLSPPAGTAPGPVQLQDCISNEDGGWLIPVETLVANIRALKDDRDGRISVAAIVAPPLPYAVEWTAAGAADPANPAELWPSVMRSCGAAGDPAVNPRAVAASTDGSRGEPAVRIGQFVGSFPHALIASICDASYRSTMAALASSLGTVVRGLKCASPSVLTDAGGQPACNVMATYLDPLNAPVQVSIPNCAPLGLAPCWQAVDTGPADCPGGGRAIQVEPAPEFRNAPGLIYDVSCRACGTGTHGAGCL